MFWRKKKSGDDGEDELLHHKGEPDLEPPTEYDSVMSADLEHEIYGETEEEILEDLDVIPTPEHNKLDDLKEAGQLHDDSREGGWFSKLTKGLSKSSKKITEGLTDAITRKKLDQATLDELEEALIAADLGPSTAARLVEDFGKDRFGKDVSEEEIREALAAGITKILEPVTQELEFNKPADGPFVVLVCGGQDNDNRQNRARSSYP